MLRIFTDTAANIPPHLLEQYHITAMPLTYLLDGQPTELVGHDYYEAMRKGAEVKTSLVSPALIRDTMESALRDGDDVLYIAISGGISGTCWSAELMAEELRGEYPDRMIRVLNTCGASLGEGPWCWRQPKCWKRAARQMKSSGRPRKIAGGCASSSWWTT